MKTLTISPSQLEAFDSEEGDGCPRKWWADKKLRLPRPPSKASTAFGTCFHSVCERYLLADDLGRDQAGQPVELYPEGWATVTERNGAVSKVPPIEQDLARALFDKLVEQGFIARWPGRLIEYEFGAVWKDQPAFPVIEYRGYSVGITGLIDVCLPQHYTVLDWKTTKNLRYAKSPNKLRKSLQMLVYGKVLFSILEAQGAAVPEQINLVHVVACKDPDNPKVKRTSVTVSRKEIEDGWVRVQRLAQSMVDTLIFEKEENWFDVPGPREGSRACNAYGGCPRQQVCGGRHTVEQHRNIVDSLIRSSVESAASPERTNPGEPMGILSNRAAQGGQPVQLVAVPQQPVAVPQLAQPVAVPQQPVVQQPAQPAAPVVQPAVAAPEVPANSTPPWADPNCTACGDSGHNGFNTAGEPCRICNSTSAARNGPLSDHYQVTYGEGVRHWTARPEHQQALQAAGAALQGVTAVPATSPVQVAPTPNQAPPAQPQAAPEPRTAPPSMPTPPQLDPVPETVPEAAAPDPEPVGAPTDPSNVPSPAGPVTADEELVKPKAGRGRPKGSFTLYINCAPTGTSVEDLGQIHKRMGEQLAANSGVASYYELHPFQRRDCINAAAQQVATFLGKAKVVAMANGPDMVSFIDAIRPYASSVVEARLPVLQDGR